MTKAWPHPTSWTMSTTSWVCPAVSTSCSSGVAAVLATLPSWQFAWPKPIRWHRCPTSTAWMASGTSQPWCRPRRGPPHRRWIPQPCQPSLGTTSGCVARGHQSMFVTGCSWTFGFCDQIRYVHYVRYDALRARGCAWCSRPFSLWNTVRARVQMFSKAKVLMATDLGLLRTFVYVRNPDQFRLCVAWKLADTLSAWTSCGVKAPAGFATWNLSEEQLRTEHGAVGWRHTDK